MPIFSNAKEEHEVRINALTMIFYMKPSTTDLARILAVLKDEREYEVINFAYTLFEQFANTINPCHKEVSEKAKFFLKFMRQYSTYESTYGFGVSKTWMSEYQEPKYGYGGSLHYMVTGSQKSIAPLTLYVGIANTFKGSHSSQGVGFFIRVEGAFEGISFVCQSISLFLCNIMCNCVF